MLDLPDEAMCAQYFKKMQGMKIILDTCITGSPQDALKICLGLSAISEMFTVAAAETQVELLGQFQKYFTVFDSGFEPKSRISTQLCPRA